VPKSTDPFDRRALLRARGRDTRREEQVIFVGIDWSERHHDVCLMDAGGTQLAGARVPDGIEGMAELHGLLSDHAEEPEEVIVGIETDRGLLVGALVAAGYRVYAINLLSVDRYRDRHRTSGAKSDPGDAKVLADIVRTDRHNHRAVAGDSELTESVKLLARTHQSFVWERQRHVNRLRSALREFYPAALEAFGTDLASADAIAVLTAAPTPELGRHLSRSKIAAALRRAGRKRNIESRAEKIQRALRSEQLRTAPSLEQTYGVITSSLICLIAGLNTQIARLEQDLHGAFEQHPDAEIILGLPGLDSDPPSAPGCSASSETIRPATPMLGRDATTRRPRRSPRPQAPTGWCWPDSPATTVSPTRVTCGRSHRSALRRERAATTTPCGHGARPTTRRSAPWRIASSGSCTAASLGTSPTGRMSPGRSETLRPLDTLEPWDISPLAPPQRCMSGLDRLRCRGAAVAYGGPHALGARRH
jgi:transposase